MPDLLLPILASTSVSTDLALPSTLHYYQLPGANVTISHQSWGTVFIQELRVNGFTFGYLVFQVFEPVTLLFASNSDSGILHYLLQGKVSFLQQQSQWTLLLEKRTCCLGHHHTGSELEVAIEPGEHHYFQVAFSPNFLHHLLHSLTPPSYSEKGQPLQDFVFQHYILPISKKLYTDITSIFNHSPQSANDFLYLNNLALQLTSRFITDTRAYRQKQYWEQKKHLKLEELEAYILDHLDTESKKFVSLSACARKTGTSTYYFKKLFRQQYGLSPAFFIRKMRMEKAMQIITKSSSPAGDIYQDVGYENFSSFTRAFHAYYGHPPSFYRNP